MTQVTNTARCAMRYIITFVTREEGTVALGICVFMRVSMSKPGLRQVPKS